MRGIAVIIVLAGCTFPTKPGDPFACVGQSLPTTAPSRVDIRGIVVDPIGAQGDGTPGAATTDLGTPVAAASETLFVIGPSGSIPRGTWTTKDDGTFTASEATGGGVQRVFIQSQADGYLDSFSYPPLPLAYSIDVLVFQARLGLVPALVNAGYLRPIEPMTAFMIASVVDCNDNPVEGATIDVIDSGVHDQNHPIVKTYFANVRPDPSATQTDSLTGSAFVSGLVPGAVTVRASLGTIPFKENKVTVAVDALTIAEVSP
jgi:hypothetical protein